MSKIFFLFFYFVMVFSSFGELVSSSGEWTFDRNMTQFILCAEFKQNDTGNYCRMQKEGAFYQLKCPVLESNLVELRELAGSYYCYAQKNICQGPKPCNILEKVVHRPGVDFCQHGELKVDRECASGQSYRIDYKNLETEKIVDECCRKVEIFSRPAVWKSTLN